MSGVSICEVVWVLGIEGEGLGGYQPGVYMLPMHFF